MLYGANTAVHSRYDDASTTADLDRLRATNNGLSAASGVGLVATLGLGGAVVFVR